MSDELQVIKVNVNDRYIMILELPLDYSAVECQELGQHFAERLTRWWLSGDKFTVVTAQPGTRVRLERVSDED